MCFFICSLLYLEKHCLSEKHVYQTLLVLRLLFLTAGNIISKDIILNMFIVNL